MRLPAPGIPRPVNRLVRWYRLASSRGQEYLYAVQKQGLASNHSRRVLEKMSIQQKMDFQSGFLKVDASGEFSLEAANSPSLKCLGLLSNIRLRKYCSMSGT